MYNVSSICITYLDIFYDSIVLHRKAANEN